MSLGMGLGIGLSLCLESRYFLYSMLSYFWFLSSCEYYEN